MPISSDFFVTQPEVAHLIELMSDGVFVCDMHGWLVDANSAACNLLGFARETIRTLNLVDLLSAHEESFIQPKIVEFLDQRSGRSEWVLRHKSGSDLFVDVATRKRADGHFICILHDKTKRRMAEAALINSQQRIMLAIEATGIGIWEWNVHTDAVTWDAALFRIYGIPETADRRITYDTWVRAVHPEDRERQDQLLRKHAGENTINRREFRILRPNGETRYIEAVETIRCNREGQIDWVIGTNLDITERKESENTLRAREAHLRQFYESKLIGVFYWNMAGQVLDANDKFLDMLGYNRTDLTAGRIDWQEMTPKEYKHLDERSVSELQMVGLNTSPFEKCYVRKDGSLLPVLVAGAMLDEARFNGVAFILDISDRRRADERSRLLLHEMNYRAKNLLAVVQGMAIQTAKDEDQAAFVGRFLSRLSSLAACHDLVVQSEWQGVALSDLINTQLASFREAHGRRISCDGPSLQLKPDAAQALSMALHELATNAVKYGCFTGTAGVVKICWGSGSNEGTARFWMSWEETNVPAVGSWSGRIGFGRKILVNMIEYALDASVSLDYPSTGCRWTFTAPLNRVCAINQEVAISLN